MKKKLIRLLSVALFSVIISSCSGGSSSGGNSGGGTNTDHCKWNDVDSKWNSCTLSAR